MKTPLNQIDFTSLAVTSFNLRNGIIEIYDIDGELARCEPLKTLADYVEKNNMNCEEGIYIGNDSPNGDGDPAYDIETEVTHDIMKYLENNIEEIAEMYYREMEELEYAA